MSVCGKVCTSLLFDRHQPDPFVLFWVADGTMPRGRVAADLVREAKRADYPVGFADMVVRRLWARWTPGMGDVSLDEGALVACHRDEQDAEPFWQITVKGEEHNLVAPVANGVSR